MQTSLREEVDADLAEKDVVFTEYKTARNAHEVYCGDCNRTLYADRETSEKLHRSMGHFRNNPLLCDECRQEYEDLAFER